MKKSTLSIHSENILPIIKKWLYSEKNIFLRELVSNACDALSKLKILSEQGQAQCLEEELAISIRIDKAAKTLTISDTGIGMTADEVEKYIAQIAFSGAEEFVGKYQAQTEKDPIIGHFGLGFYSAYMVAKLVEIHTLSYLPEAKPAFWSCDGTSSYTIDEGTRHERGTDIVLHLNEESLEFLEEATLREQLTRNFRFLPFVIRLNDTSIGAQKPLWLKNPSECTDDEYLSFYRTLFPLDPDPIFWVHLNVDYPFTLKGILYFPKVHRRFDAKESKVMLFCNRVYVSDNCTDILPDYLTILRGAIDSPDIPLNVSRSYLQVDKNVRQLSAHISKKVADRLVVLYKTEREKFISHWADIETLLKLGILQEEKFYEKIKECLIWKNSEGSWTTLPEYLERNPNAKVFYTPENKTGSIGNAYLEKKIEFLYSNALIDTALFSFLEEKHTCKFQRIDGALDATLLDPSREKSILDADGKTQSVKIAEFIRKALSDDKVEVEAKSLTYDTLPGIVLLKEEERRMRDYLALTQGQSLPHFLSKKTFVVNTNNKLVQAIERLQNKKPDLAKDLACHLYSLSLLAQKELEPSQVETVLSQNGKILEALADLV